MFTEDISKGTCFKYLSKGIRSIDKRKGEEVEDGEPEHSSILAKRGRRVISYLLNK